MRCKVFITKTVVLFGIVKAFLLLTVYFRPSGQPQNMTASGDKAFEDWLNDDLGSYQG